METVMPNAEQLAGYEIRKLEVQAEWSPEERLKRTQGIVGPVEVPVVRHLPSGCGGMNFD